VNTFEAPDTDSVPTGPRELMRSSDAEKDARLDALAGFHARWAVERDASLERLQDVARSGGNVFEELMETVKTASLGQISNALFDVGGRYRRSM